MEGLSGTTQPAGVPDNGQQAGGSNHAFQDYQMQKALVEQQNKKRLKMARTEQDRLEAAQTIDNPDDGPPGPPTGGSNYALQDYQMQLALVEQHNKKIVKMAHEGPDCISSTIVDESDQAATMGGISLSKEDGQHAEGSSDALNEWHTQLMLLEEENNRRLISLEETSPDAASRMRTRLLEQRVARQQDRPNDSRSHIKVGEFDRM